MPPPPPPDPLDLPHAGRIPFLFVVTELARLGMDDAGVALWQAIRNVGTWRDAGERGRERILARGPSGLPALVPDAAEALRALDARLRAPAGRGAPAEVAAACARVAEWAEGAGAVSTAAAFFLAAQALCGGDPRLGYDVGRVARKLALYDAAEGWLRWADRVARHQRRWEVAALCASGLGNVFRQRGNLPRARRQHQVALRLARRHRLRVHEGDALYDLAGLAFAFGDSAEGTRLVRRAIEAYGPGHERVHRIAKDVAWMWMDRHGEFAAAARVFGALLDRIREPPHRVMLLASLARAAAGAGLREEFERGWEGTWELVRRHAGRERHAAALVQLALGAGSLGEWTRAAEAAAEAQRVATERREGEARLVAESILDAVRGGALAEEAARAVFRDRGRAPAPGGTGAPELARALESALSAGA